MQRTWRRLWVCECVCVYVRECIENGNIYTWGYKKKQMRKVRNSLTGCNNNQITKQSMYKTILGLSARFIRSKSIRAHLIHIHRYRNKMEQEKNWETMMKTKRSSESDINIYIYTYTYIYIYLYKARAKGKSKVKIILWKVLCIRYIAQLTL